MLFRSEPAIYYIADDPAIHIDHDTLVEEIAQVICCRDRTRCLAPMKPLCGTRSCTRRYSRFHMGELRPTAISPASLASVSTLLHQTDTRTTTDDSNIAERPRQASQTILYEAMGPNTTQTSWRLPQTSPRDVGPTRLALQQRDSAMAAGDQLQGNHQSKVRRRQDQERSYPADYQCLLQGRGRSCEAGDSSACGRSRGWPRQSG